MRDVLEMLNAMDRADFTRALGAVFEHSPWVAERAFTSRPFNDIAQLHNAMVSAMRNADRDERFALLNAHPELAGKEAQSGAMTDASKTEQAVAGLGRLSPDEAARINSLNAQYRTKFGHPFIIAVRNHGKDDIFAEFERRLRNSPDVELQAALAEIAEITRMRLAALVPG